MPLKLKSFSQPDQPRRFQPEILRRLLEPFRLFFEMKGLFVSGLDNRKIDLASLAAILAEPDEEMPSDLVEALHLIEHLGTNEYFDDLLQLAADNGIDPIDEATAPDLAVLVWLRNPLALERKDREGLFQQRKIFDSFRTADPDSTLVLGDIPDHLGPLEAALGNYFEAKKRGIGCRVIRKDSPGEVRFLVQHGQPCKREPSRKGALSTSTFFRPEKTDIVIVDAAHKELRINASCKPDLRKYRELFGLHLFADAEKFVYREKYTLEPLRAQGEAALRCKDVEGIESVRLSQLEFDWGTEFEHVERHAALDVFKALAARQARIPEQSTIRRAVFGVKLDGEKKVRAVSVKAGNQAGYQRSEECMVVEQWLWTRGYIRLGTKACAEAA